MEPGFGYDRDVDFRIGQELAEELSFVGDGPGIRRSNGWEAVSKRRAEDGGLGWWCLSSGGESGVAVFGWVGNAVAA